MIKVHAVKELRKRTALCFTFFFLVIFAYYVAKPVKSSLFLEWLGPAQLPLGYALSALVCLLGAYVFEFRLKRQWPRSLVTAILALFVLGFLVFRGAFLWLKAYSPLFSLAFFVYISFFAVAGVALFWAVCNDSFTSNESSQVYGYIGVGGILGGLLGSIFTQYVTPWLGTENMLFISAGTLALTLPLPLLLSDTVHGKASEHDVWWAEWRSEAAKTKAGGLMGILKTPLLRDIACVVLFSTMMMTLFDFQYQTIIKSADLSKDARTILFSKIFTYINLIGILIHIAGSRRILRRWGPVTGLWPLPVLCLGAVFALKVSPQISTVVVLWTGLGAVMYSLQQVSKESMYVPAPRAIKYVAKGYIDTFVYRAGDALASLIIVWNTYFSHGVAAGLLGYNLVLGIFWIWIVWAIYRLGRHRTQAA